MSPATSNFTATPADNRKPTLADPRFLTHKERSRPYMNPFTSPSQSAKKTAPATPETGGVTGTRIPATRLFGTVVQQYQDAVKKSRAFTSGTPIIEGASLPSPTKDPTTATDDHDKGVTRG